MRRSSRSGGGVVVAAWIGYSLGDALAFALLRTGLPRRLPRRWQARIDASALRHVGARAVFVSRLVPGSAVVNALAAAGGISTRRFVAAATLGELCFAGAILTLGAGGAALVERSLPLAGGVAAAALAAALLRRGRRRQVRGAAPAAPAPRAAA